MIVVPPARLLNRDHDHYVLGNFVLPRLLHWPPSDMTVRRFAPALLVTYWRVVSWPVAVSRTLYLSSAMS